MPGPKVAKIDVKNPAQKTAIVGISLNGNGRHTKEEVTALIKQANKFGKCIILLHGDAQQCTAWRKENEDSLVTIKVGTMVFDWNELQGKVEYQNKVQEFTAFYNKPENSDFKNKIDETVELYLKRHPEDRKNTAGVRDFVIEEMAFLTQIAIANRVDCFIYTGRELPAFYATKRDFFTGANQNLLQWAELSFGEAKVKKEQKQLPPMASASALPPHQPFSSGQPKISYDGQGVKIKQQESTSLVTSLVGFFSEAGRLNGRLQRYQELVLTHVTNNPSGSIDPAIYAEIIWLHGVLTETVERLKTPIPAIDITRPQK